MRANRSFAVVVAMVALTLAGCVDENADPANEKESESPFNYEDDRFKIRGINESAKDWVPTLEEPPEWALGQWWKVRLTDRFVGDTVEAYRVVAGQEDDHWLVGMPTHDFSNDLMVMHVPGYGQIRKADLGFEAHDHWWEFLPFPLTEDKSWTTSFEAADNIECSVMTVEGLKATIECIGAYHITYTYDAEMRAVTKFDAVDYATYEVIDSGMAFHEDVPELDGQVTVPHMSDLIFFHGRLAGAVQMSPEGGPVAGFNAYPVPFDEVEVDSTYDRVSFSIILGDILRQGIPPTVYQVKATSPDGDVYESMFTPLDGGNLKIDSFKDDAPGGMWNIEYVSPGPGVAFIEGIGYHVYDVQLPSGHILPSIGEHQHGSEGGH